jgi:hypothetical protein
MPAAEMDQLERIVTDALEEGGINGLCLEGRIDLAVDRLRRAYPDMDAASALKLVKQLANENN